MLESIGVPVQIAVSKQTGSDFDHVFLFLPTIKSIFDLTIRPVQFPANSKLYPGLKLL